MKNIQKTKIVSRNLLRRVKIYPRYHSNCGIAATSDSDKPYSLTRTYGKAYFHFSIPARKGWVLRHWVVGSHHTPTLWKPRCLTVFVKAFWGYWGYYNMSTTKSQMFSWQKLFFFCSGFCAKLQKAVFLPFSVDKTMDLCLNKHIRIWKKTLKENLFSPGDLREPAVGVSRCQGI